MFWEIYLVCLTYLTIRFIMEIRHEHMPVDGLEMAHFWGIVFFVVTPVLNVYTALMMLFFYKSPYKKQKV